MKTPGLILISTVVLVSGFILFKTRATKTPEQIPLTPAPTIRETSLHDQVVAALSRKNNWEASRVEVNVATTEGNYAKGDVKFKDEMGGGLWFAAKVNDSWKIVYDGNGMITCDALTEYKDFPKDLIPQCFDKQTNTMTMR